MKVLVTYDLSEELVGRIKNAFPTVTVEKELDPDRIKRAIVDADAVFAGKLSADILAEAKQLKWVQSRWAGVDRFLFPEFVNSDVVLTDAGGIHANAISDHVLGIMLAFTRRLNMFMRSQIQKKWLRLQGDELEGKTVGIVGLGNIGSKIAWKAKCFGMKIVATKRSIGSKITYVDELLPHTQLEYLLERSDFVILSVPLTAETYHMIDEKELRRMKKNAILINISRGNVIDERAIIRAVKEGWISGAGLDVFEKEPLPSDSELWNMENVMITPHCSGSTSRNREQACEIFIDNMSRFSKGQPLMNVVDKRAGY